MRPRRKSERSGCVCFGPTLGPRSQPSAGSVNNWPCCFSGGGENSSLANEGKVGKYSIERGGLKMLDQSAIMNILPHRYPFLLVDKIVELEPGERAVGLKSVSGNEPFFPGHFPGRPVMPGVLIVEALAQTGAVALLSASGLEGKIAYFAGSDKCRFRRPVVPGDQLRLEVTLTRMRGRIGKGRQWLCRVGTGKLRANLLCRYRLGRKFAGRINCCN